MRECADLIRLGTLLQGLCVGTYAGEGEFTQEQHEVLRRYGLLREHFEVEARLVAVRPPAADMVPDCQRAQAEIRMMLCPILGEGILLMPDGLLLQENAPS